MLASNIMKRNKLKIQSPPTESILAATNVLDDAISRYLMSVKTLKDVRVYESHTEAITLNWALMRQVESIVALAREDLVLLPAALVVARATLETAARTLWLLKPDSVWEREGRWLAHLRGEEDYYKRLADFLNKQGYDGTAHTAQANTVTGFREGVEKLLPPDVKLLKGLPDFRGILKDLGRENLYQIYMKLSQFTHGGSVSMKLYKKHLGSAKQIGEFIYPEHWALPLGVCWLCVTNTGMETMAKLGGDPDALFSRAFLKRGEEAMNKV